MTTTTILTLSRGVPVLALSGTRALEALSRYELDLTLRRVELDATGAATDIGALSLRPYDPGASPVAGNGCAVHLVDGPTRRTRLATGSATIRGARAWTTWQHTPAHGDTIAVTYVDLSDETVATPAEITRTYRFQDPATAAPSAVLDIGVGATAEASLDNLVRALNGSLDYGDRISAYPGTPACAELVAYRSTSDTIRIETRDGGVWGNYCSIAPSAGTPSAATKFAGGTGSRGIRITFESSALPMSILGPADVQRQVHLDLVGVDSDAQQTKLAVCPATIHATDTDTLD